MTTSCATWTKTTIASASPGFTKCALCGSLLSWNFPTRQYSSAALGETHGCTVGILCQTAIWNYIVRLNRPRRFP